MSAEHTPALRAENLTKRYRSGSAELVVFDGLELEVARGERVAVVGASGEGKSTLLHLLGALDRPTSGKVFFGSQNIFELGEADLARFRNHEIGFVWQQSWLLPEFTALENVAMPLLVRGIPPDEAERAAGDLLNEVGLSGRTWHRSGELSGGEQQRVALARALVGRPKVLLADEPTGNLDHRTGDHIAALLAELHRSHGLTSVIVTHNFEFARGCDRILQLEKGVFAPWRGDPAKDRMPLGNEG